VLFQVVNYCCPLFTTNVFSSFFSLADNKKHIEKINKLYSIEWSQLGNFFCPTLKLIEKTRIHSKYKRKHVKPETPYQRLIESNVICGEIKSKFKSRSKTLAPFQLKASF